MAAKRGPDAHVGALMPRQERPSFLDLGPRRRQVELEVVERLGTETRVVPLGREVLPAAWSKPVDLDRAHCVIDQPRP